MSSDDRPDPARRSALPGWLKMLAGLVVGVGVAQLFGERLSGWALAVFLLGSALWEQVADLLHSLSEWVELRWGETTIVRHQEVVADSMERSHQALMRRLSGVEDEASRSEVQTDAER